MRSARAASSRRTPLLLLLCLSAASCAADPPVDVVAELRITPAAPIVGQETSVELTLKDRFDLPVRVSALQLEGHMEHPGMAPVVVEASEQADGRYSAGMTFTMAGDWVVFARGALVSGGTRMRIEVGRVSVRGTS